MKLIEEQPDDTVSVSIQMTRDELRLITQGLGNTSQTSRINAGMQPSESSSIFDLYCTLVEACRQSGIELNYNR